MLKYLSSAIVFAEFPDEICLALNITGCPCMCDHCSEPELRPDIGTEITEEELLSLIEKNKGITMIGFMGGDRDHKAIVELSKIIHSTGLKVGMYSGRDSLDMNLLNCLDYYKIGKWIMPEGNVDDWWKKNCGPLKFTFSNQLMFKKENNLWINITNRFRNRPINNLKKEILE